MPLTADDETGLAIALGGAGMTVRDLAMLYAALGDGGRALPLRWLKSEADPLADNDTRGGMAQNRRVAVNILVSKAVEGIEQQGG